MTDMPLVAAPAENALPRTALTLAVAVFGMFCLLVVRGINGFPLNADHSYFLPVSAYFNATGHLDNPWLNPINSHSFNWHGFLQPWLVAKLSLGGGWNGVDFGIDALATLAFLLALVAAVRLGLGKAEVAGLALMTLALMLDMRSRPEVLASALAVALVWALARQRAALFGSPRLAISCGALFGTLLCAHPAIFVLSVLAFAGFWLSELSRQRPNLHDVAVQLGITAAVFAAFVLVETYAIYGDSPAVWLAGIVQHATRTGARQDTSGFVGYFLANRFLPGIGLGMLFAVPLALRFWQTPDWPMLPRRLGQGAQVLYLALTALVFYRIAVRVPATYYNFSGLMPAFAIAGCLGARGELRFERLMQSGLVLLGLSGLLGSLLWLGQNVLDGPLIHPSAMALNADVHAELAQGRRVCADASVLTAVEDMRDAAELHLSVPASDEERSPSRTGCDVYFRLQAQLNLPNPGEIPGFRLASDHFISHPKLLGWMRPLNYGYAVFRSETISGG